MDTDSSPPREAMPDYDIGPLLEWLGEAMTLLVRASPPVDWDGDEQVTSADQWRERKKACLSLPLPRRAPSARHGGAEPDDLKALCDRWEQLAGRMRDGLLQYEGDPQPAWAEADRARVGVYEQCARSLRAVADGQPTAAPRATAPACSGCGEDRQLFDGLCHQCAQDAIPAGQSIAPAQAEAGGEAFPYKPSDTSGDSITVKSDRPPKKWRIMSEAEVDRRCTEFDNGPNDDKWQADFLDKFNDDLQETVLGLRAQIAAPPDALRAAAEKELSELQWCLTGETRWEGHDVACGECPRCGGIPEPYGDGHASDCSLAAILRRRLPGGADRG